MFLEENILETLQDIILVSQCHFQFLHHLYCCPFDLDLNLNIIENYIVILLPFSVLTSFILWRAAL